MTKKEKEVLSIFRLILPQMTALEREKLLSFGEGVAFAKAAGEEFQHGMKAEQKNEKPCDFELFPKSL